MSRIIIIEGPNCVGKTTLVDYLIEKLNIPVYHNVMGPGSWKHSDDGYVEFITLFSMWRYPKVEFLLDRGLFSFQYYNPEWRRNDIITDLFNKLEKWDYAKVICMMSTHDNLIKNALNKNKVEGTYDEIFEEELVWFSNSFNQVPKEFKIDCFIKKYDGPWKEEILEELK